MLIGQMVAISYASALVFAVREATPVPPSPKKNECICIEQIGLDDDHCHYHQFLSLRKCLNTLLFECSSRRPCTSLPSALGILKCTTVEDYDFTVIRDQRRSRCSSALGELLFDIQKWRFGIHFWSYFRASSDEFGWMGRHL